MSRSYAPDIYDCRSCGAPMRWAVTTAGKRMPLDPQPSDRGNVHVDDDGTATVLGPLEVQAHDGPLYVPHFATCDDPDRFRKAGAS